MKKISKYTDVSDIITSVGSFITKNQYTTYFHATKSEFIYPHGTDIYLDLLSCHLDSSLSY